MLDNIKRWININIRKVEYFVAVDYPETENPDYGCLHEGYKDKKSKFHIVHTEYFRVNK